MAHYGDPNYAPSLEGTQDSAIDIEQGDRDTLVAQLENIRQELSHTIFRPENPSYSRGSRSVERTGTKMSHLVGIPGTQPYFAFDCDQKMSRLRLAIDSATGVTNQTVQSIHEALGDIRANIISSEYVAGKRTKLHSLVDDATTTLGQIQNKHGAAGASQE